MDYTINTATATDLDGILALLPRLADFDIPASRNPDHLWQGDADMVREWAEGNRDDVHIRIATASNDIVGVAVVSERKEMLSGEPSAHLEVLALAKSAEGFGMAAALIDASCALAKERGAKTLSLNVFAKNTKARALYERKGFDGEFMRYIKPL